MKILKDYVINNNKILILGNKEYEIIKRLTNNGKLMNVNKKQLKKEIDMFSFSFFKKYDFEDFKKSVDSSLKFSSKDISEEFFNEGLFNYQKFYEYCEGFKVVIYYPKEDFFLVREGAIPFLLRKEKIKY